jgi:hypothetical protein
MNWQLGWQDVVAATLVAWALWYLCRRVVGVVRRDAFTGCGTCVGCGGAGERADKNRRGFVVVESLNDSTRKKRPGGA